jgi:hypothetical protein
MRRLIATLVLAAGLSGCPEEPTSAPPPSAPNPVARLTELEGPVTLERDGGVAKATVGPLFPGDVVATGPAARAVLADDRGRRLELGEETRFTVGASLSSLEVDIGEIVFLTEDDGGTAWGGASLATPFGKATLGAGTAARLKVRDGGLSMQVSIGEIEFEEVDGGAHKATAGQGFEVSIGEIELEAPALPPPPRRVLLQVEAGKPQVKPKGAERFFPVVRDTPLEAGAAFQVPNGARAKLAGDGLVLLVQPGARGMVESVENGGGVSVLALTGAAGPVTLRLDGKQKARLELDDVALSGSQETTAAVTLQGKKRRIEVRVGELNVTHAGQSKTVKAGEVLVVGSGTIEEPQPLKPALTVPIGKRVQVYADKLGLVGLGLPDDEPHRVQVATDSNFEALVLEGTAAKQVVVPAPAKGELFWRVLDDAGQVQAQGRARFGADTASLKDTAAKTDTVAETGLKATVFFQRHVPTLTFVFAPTPGASGYRLRVYRVGELKTPVVERKVPEPRATVESGQLGEGSYLWSASPLDASGNESGGGRMNKLDIVYDNSLTSLTIASPKNGEKWTASLRAAGVAPLDSSLTINGRAVPLDAQGRFSVPVPDSDTVVFRLKTDGGDTFWVRRLRR